MRQNRTARCRRTCVATSVTGPRPLPRAPAKGPRAGAQATRYRAVEPASSGFRGWDSLTGIGGRRTSPPFRRLAPVPFTSGSRREPLIDGQTMPSSFGLDGQWSPSKGRCGRWLSTDLEARTRLLPHPVGCGNAGQLGMMSWDGLSARGTRGHRPSASREMGLELQGRP